MKTVSVTQLRASLSEYLSYVREGEEIIVTERGKPIARIVPYAVEGDDDARRQDLIRQGLLKPGKGSLSAEFLHHRKHRNIQGRLLDVLHEERESGL